MGCTYPYQDVTAEATHLTLAVVFPSAHPFSNKDFESVVMPLGGELGDGFGRTEDGNEFGISAFRFADSKQVIVYAESRGELSLRMKDSVDFGDVKRFREKVVQPLLEKAGINEQGLSYVEAQYAFLSRANKTALHSLNPKLPPVPTWAEDILGQKMAPWGYRIVREDAKDWSQSFKKRIPWYEVTIEPFVDNPLRIWTKFIVRDASFDFVTKEILRAPEVAERILNEATTR